MERLFLSEHGQASLIFIVLPLFAFEVRCNFLGSRMILPFCTPPHIPAISFCSGLWPSLAGLDSEMLKKKADGRALGARNFQRLTIISRTGLLFPLSLLQTLSNN